MDSLIDDKSIVLPVVNSDKEHKNPKLVVLHQNICSLERKTTELEEMLRSRVKACRCKMPHRTLAE